jgi:hypothetical protein
VRDVRHGAAREVVEHVRAIATLQQAIDEVTADEAGATGDQDRFAHRHLLANGQSNGHAARGILRAGGWPSHARRATAA